MGTLLNNAFNRTPRKPGFIVDKRDTLGTTLLMEAARQGQMGMLYQCLEEKSDLNAVDNAGRNALMYALDGKCDSTAAILLNRGIDAERADNNKNTPLIEACLRMVPEVIQRLVQKKVALDAQNIKGNTALMLACAAGDGWAACVLVDAGADFGTLKNYKGATALDVARAGLRPDDHKAFLQCVTKQLEKRRAAAVEAAAEKERQLAQDVQDATVVSKEVKLLKPVAFRPKGS